MVAAPDRPVLVIGVGNRLRGDDVASWRVVRRLCERGTHTRIEVSEQLREPTDLLEAWQGRDAVVLALLTRDPKRVAAYIPGTKLIAP